MNTNCTEKIPETVSCFVMNPASEDALVISLCSGLCEKQINQKKTADQSAPWKSHDVPISRFSVRYACEAGAFPFSRITGTIRSSSEMPA